MNNNNVFGENIQRLRKGCHITQEELAERIGKSKQTVSKWENGDTHPNHDSVEKLAQVFGVPEATLMYGYTPEDTTPNEEMKKIYEAINSINMRISLISSNMVTEKYLNSSLKFKEDYYKEEYEQYLNQLNEPDMSEEEFLANEYERERDKHYVVEALGNYDFNGAINICDAHISDGDAEFAATAIQVYDDWHEMIPYEDEDEYLEDMKEQSKYAKIYIHYLMKRFHIQTDDLLPV